MDYKLLKREPEAEGIIGSGIRQIVRSGTNALSNFLGYPLEALTSLAKGLSPTTVEEEFKQLPQEKQQKLLENPQFKNQLERPFGIPKIEDIKSSIGSKLPEDYLKPRNQIEEFSDQIFSDLGTILSPVGLGGITKTLPTAAKVGRALKGSALGNLSATVAKSLGFNENVQTLSKLGGLLIGSTIKPINFNDIKDVSRIQLDRLNSTKDFLKKNLPIESITNPITLALYYGVQNHPKLATGIVAGVHGLREINRYAHRIYNDPSILKAYGKTFKDAAEQNINLLHKDISKLDTMINKKFPMDNNNEGKYRLLKKVT